MTQTECLPVKKLALSVYKCVGRAANATYVVWKESNFPRGLFFSPLLVWNNEAEHLQVVAAKTCLVRTTYGNPAHSVNAAVHVYSSVNMPHGTARNHTTRGIRCIIDDNSPDRFSFPQSTEKQIPSDFIEGGPVGLKRAVQHFIFTYHVKSPSSWEEKTITKQLLVR